MTWIIVAAIVTAGFCYVVKLALGYAGKVDEQAQEIGEPEQAEQAEPVAHVGYAPGFPRDGESLGMMHAIEFYKVGRFLDAYTDGKHFRSKANKIDPKYWTEWREYPSGTEGAYESTKKIADAWEALEARADWAREAVETQKP